MAGLSSSTALEIRLCRDRQQRSVMGLIRSPETLTKISVGDGQRRCKSTALQWPLVVDDGCLMGSWGKREGRIGRRREAKAGRKTQAASTSNQRPSPMHFYAYCITLRINHTATKSSEECKSFFLCK